jgi:hypothetical protein
MVQYLGWAVSVKHPVLQRDADAAGSGISFITRNRDVRVSVTSPSGEGGA